MFEIIFVAVTVALMATAWWWLKRRRRELLGDAGESHATGAEPAEPQALTRDALVNRSRAFDPNAWDDGPDPVATAPRATAPAPGPAPAADETEPPAYFDREFLERQRRQRLTDPPPNVE